METFNQLKYITAARAYYACAIIAFSIVHIYTLSKEKSYMHLLVEEAHGEINKDNPDLSRLKMLEDIMTNLKKPLT